ncbi:metal ABC transporter permease [Candidatus Woesearchaeota archaeon CG10_big_fil_rev_8_21_14_0_10_32_9]|nr:MAG: metal ABC transporter permease [Candidatus Woesearchaeota archaeon CG10_big_fil_rev_8_21_14_0_10_32_9]
MVDVDKQKIDMKYNLQKYWDLITNYKLLSVGILVVILLLQASYTLESYLFKELVDKITLFTSQSLTADTFVSFLFLLAAVFVSIVVLRSALKWIHLHWINLLDSAVMYDLKTKLFNHILKLSHGFHSSNKTGSIISRLIRGAGAIERMTDVVVFNFAPLLFQAIVVGIAIAFFDTTSALIILVIVVVFVVFSFFVNRLQQPANLTANDAEDSEKAVISDIFTNVDSIKYFGKEEFIKKRYAGYGMRTRTATMRHWDYFRWLSAGHALILGLGVLAILIVPMQKVIAGTLTVGELVFIYTAFGNLVGPLFGFDHGLRGFYRSMADFESLFKYYKVENEIKDDPSAKNLIIKKGTIDFQNVSFKYKNRYVLNNFTLSIPENRKIALVGPSGSGKSTLVKVLYRLYDLNKGEILIDGENINSVRQESLRSELSIVPQEAVLFDDTIYNNILFSNKSASRRQVLQAMKFAQLDKVVSSFPLKENTVVGERGVKLSGGEKQRVSIARAILANKKILVLDEATSALDSETESEIQKDLERLMKGRTSIIIAHRLSTIMKADLIVVIDKGKIVQMGTHAELIKKDGLYEKLWSLQKGGYIK